MSERTKDICVKCGYVGMFYECPKCNPRPVHTCGLGAEIRRTNADWLAVCRALDDSKQLREADNKRIKELERERDQLKAVGSPAYFAAEWKKAKQALTAHEDHHLECHKKWNEERGRLKRALEELVSQHMRADNGEGLLFGHLVANAREALKDIK